MYKETMVASMLPENSNWQLGSKYSPVMGYVLSDDRILIGIVVVNMILNCRDSFKRVSEFLVMVKPKVCLQKVQPLTNRRRIHHPKWMVSAFQIPIDQPFLDFPSEP